jgi:hypothetical protein
MKLKFSRHSLEKYVNIKFHENPSTGSRVPCGLTDGRMDRHDEGNSLFCERAQKLHFILRYSFVIIIEILLPFLPVCGSHTHTHTHTHKDGRTHTRLCRLLFPEPLVRHVASFQTLALLPPPRFQAIGRSAVSNWEVYFFNCLLCTHGNIPIT